MSSVNEWLEQFTERYDNVGRLVRDASEIQSYEEEEDESSRDDSKEESIKDKWMKQQKQQKFAHTDKRDFIERMLTKCVMN